MRIKAALYNADHLEYGLVTIPFPIPQDQYNDTIKMLEALDIGDPRAKDCMVEEIEGCVPSLKCLEGHRINVDELDYLVKRLDSFSDGELAQFQGMAIKMGLSDMTDLINLTFCCQEATVITDFSDLEERLNYYIEHVDESLEIIRHAHEYVSQFKDKRRENLISLLVLDKYFKMTGQKS